MFRITGVGMVAGCYVLDGKMQRGAQMRLLRDNIVIYDGASPPSSASRTA